jgi:hypothetical protein
MEVLEVLHDEFPLEGRYGVLQKCCAGCSEGNVINVKQTSILYLCCTGRQIKTCWIWPQQAQGGDICGEMVVPCSGRLLPPVEKLVGNADTTGLWRINKSSWLAVVDGLREGAVQECVLHIKLLNGARSGIRSGRASCE